MWCAGPPSAFAQRGGDIDGCDRIVSAGDGDLAGGGAVQGGANGMASCHEGARSTKGQRWAEEG